MNGTVLVTGGASRIGREICLKFASVGYCVLVHTRSRRADAETTARDCVASGAPAAHALVHPMRNPSEARRLLATATLFCHDAPLAGVVANAGHFVPDVINGADDDRLLAHAGANFLLPVIVLRTLVAHHWGCGTQGWFTFLSDQKIWNPNPDYFSYTLSKGMLPGALPNLAVAAAPHVRVNAVVPGLALPSGAQTQENFARVHGATPLARGTHCRDIALACHFLAGAQATTGHCLFVDGGQRFTRSPRDVMFT